MYVPWLRPWITKVTAALATASWICVLGDLTPGQRMRYRRAWVTGLIRSTAAVSVTVGADSKVGGRGRAAAGDGELEGGEGGGGRWGEEARGGGEIGRAHV